MTGIIIIAYNNPDFILHQHAHLKAYCLDEYELLIVDNSTDSEAIEAIKWHSENLGLSYTKTNAASAKGSESHAFACCIAYQKFRDKFDILCFIDHDCFSIKPFSPEEILSNHLMAGLPQVRKIIKYFWPGLLMFKTEVDVNFNMIPGLDTGGGTHQAIEKYGEDQCVFFDEQYCQNPGFNKPPYNFYSLLHNGTFLHFINGSNWANSEENDERLNSLFNVLKTYLPDEIV